MTTIAKKGNQTVTVINSKLEESFRIGGWEIIKIETEFKNKKEEEDEWMARFGD